MTKKIFCCLNKFMPLSLVFFCFLLMLFLFNSVTYAQEAAPSHPWEAVTYIEYPTGGSFVDNGRQLKTNGNANFGADINSRIHIAVDGNKIRKELSPLLSTPEAKEKAKHLLTMLDNLISAANQINTAVKQTTDTIDEFYRAKDTNNYIEFKKKAAATATTQLLILKALHDSRLNRLQLEGISLNEADKLSKHMFDNVLRRGKGKEPYDWEALRIIFSEEIDFTQKNINRIMQDIGIQMDIQAYLITKAGAAVPIFLPGYNEVETGAANYYQKVKYEVSEEQISLYQKNLEAAKKIGEVKDLNEALLKSIELDFRAQISQIEELSSTIDAAIKGVGDKYQNVVKWADKDNRNKWLEKSKSELEKSTEGKDVILAWGKIDADFDVLINDIEFIIEFADIHAKLANMDSIQVMQLIVTTIKKFTDLEKNKIAVLSIKSQIWGKYKADINDLLSKINKLDSKLIGAITANGGPVYDLQQFAASVASLEAALDTTSAEIYNLLKKLIGISPIQMASNLPIPKNQKYIDVNKKLDTVIDFTTIKQSRSENDMVQVHYRFYRGDQIIGDGWSDIFRLRVFGCYDNFFAGFAFVQQDGQTTWKPTATLSWILDWRSWPKSNQSGLSGLDGVDLFSGIGITTMPLNFTDTQNVEFGLAPTVSLLNNRLLIGYGMNLQASHNAGFWFFSLRLFGSTGFIPK